MTDDKKVLGLAIISTYCTQFLQSRSSRDAGIKKNDQGLAVICSKTFSNWNLNLKMNGKLAKNNTWKEPASPNLKKFRWETLYLFYLAL